MPGGIWDISCPACGASARIYTGAGICRPVELSGPLEIPRFFSYRQFTCTQCGTLRSRSIGCDSDITPPTCDCGSSLKPWRGEDMDPSRDPSEVVHGPCPRCDWPIDASAVGLWD